MVETLSAAPDAIEMDTQFEDDWNAEQLSFPKLDGVLFPLVVANADVVAPCAWMGGAEVSLATALNNYYQTMTEENADEVIADTYEFLANRIDMVHEDEKKIETEEPLTRPSADKAAADESPVTMPLERDDSTKNPETTAKKILPVEQEGNINDRHASPRQAEMPSEVQVKPKSRVAEPHGPKRNDRTKTEVIDDSSGVIDETMKIQPQESVGNDSFYSVVDMPTPLQEEQQEVEPIRDDSRNLTSAAEEPAKVIEEPTPLQEILREQYDDIDEAPETFDDEDIAQLVDEEQESLDVYDGSEIQETEEHEWLNFADTTEHETDELPSDVIVQDALIQEAEDDSDDEDDFQQELQIFQSNPFMITAPTNEPERAKYSSHLSGETPPDDEWDDEAAKPAARKTGRRTSTTVATINDALSRVTIIGKIALRLHIVNSVDVIRSEWRGLVAVR